MPNVDIRLTSPEWSNWRGSELSTLETDVYICRYTLLEKRRKKKNLVILRALSTLEAYMHYIHIDIHIVIGPVWAFQRPGISPPYFPAECRKRRLNQGSFVLQFFVLFAFPE